MTSKLNINWLNKCRCGNRMHTVETVRGSHVRLFEDDAVKCNACGREGVIQTCDAIATVLWETDEERAESVTMTKSTITREQLINKAQEQIEFCRHTKITGEGRAHVNQCAALFEIALAAMDSKPVVWGNGCDKTVPAALRYLAENERPFGGESRFNAAHLYQLAREIELMAEAPLYRHAQPAPEKFNIGDATMRHIFTPTGMTNVSDMQAVFDRVEAVLVGMEQPAPVVPDFKKLARELVDNLVDCGGLDEGVKEKYLEWAEKTCRATMLVSAPQEAQVVPEKIEQSRKRVNRCDVCTEGARGGCGTCIFNGNFE